VKLSGRKKVDDVSCELPKKEERGGAECARGLIHSEPATAKEGPSNNSHSGCGRDQTENGSASDNENGLEMRMNSTVRMNPTVRLVQALTMV